MLSHLTHCYTTVLYSRKCSCILPSSENHATLFRSIPVVSCTVCTTVCIFQTLRYDLYFESISNFKFPIIKHSRFYRVTSSAHLPQYRLKSHTFWLYFFVIIEIRPTSKLSVAFATGNGTHSNAHGGLACRCYSSGHRFASLLFYNICCTLYRRAVLHSMAWDRDHVIVHIDIMINGLLVKFLDLTFKHYVVTTYTLLHYCHIFEKMFLESGDFLDPRTISQIDTSCFEYGLYYRMYLPNFTIRFIL